MTEKIYVTNAKGYVKSFEETEDSVFIPVIGIPFSSPMPDGKDLHGEYFDKSTDVGILNEVMVYFNHNQFYPASDDPDELEKAAILARAFKGEILGIARKAETTEEGVIYNIVLDKRKRYTGALIDMIKDDLLDVSSGAKYRELDPNNQGRISKWHTVEISLTPSPANPNAVPLLTKSILEKALEETKMPDEKALENEAGVVDESLVPDSVKSAFANIEPVKADETPNIVLEELTALKSQVADLQAQNQELMALVKSVRETLPYLANKMAELFNAEKSKSTFEVRAEKSVAPKPAPTPNKKPIFGNNGGPTIMGAPK